jgi:hypothetical protein
MIEMFNINCTILFAIDTLPPLQNNTRQYTALQPERRREEIIPDNVRCLIGKGDDDLSASWRMGFFVGNQLFKKIALFKRNVIYLSYIATEK